VAAKAIPVLLLRVRNSVLGFPGLVWLPSTPYNLGVLQQAFYSNPKIVMVLRTAIEAEHG
jgi:hypothetical protein